MCIIINKSYFQHTFTCTFVYNKSDIMFRKLVKNLTFGLGLVYFLLKKSLKIWLFTKYQNYFYIVVHMREIFNVLEDFVLANQCQCRKVNCWITEIWKGSKTVDGNSIPNKNLSDSEIVGLLNIRLMMVHHCNWC